MLAALTPIVSPPLVTWNPGSTCVIHSKCCHLPLLVRDVIAPPSSCPISSQLPILLNWRLPWKSSSFTECSVGARSNFQDSYLHMSAVSAFLIREKPVSSFSLCTGLLSTPTQTFLLTVPSQKHSVQVAINPSYSNVLSSSVTSIVRPSISQHLQQTSKHSSSCPIIYGFHGNSHAIKLFLFVYTRGICLLNTDDDRIFFYHVHHWTPIFSA